MALPRVLAYVFSATVFSSLPQISAAAETSGLTITNDLQTISVESIAGTLLGDGVTISNVTVKCADKALGTYSGGKDSIGIDSGVILSSGFVENIKGPNNSSGITGANGKAGDDDLELLIPGYTTHDACILEFDFTPQTTVASFRYVFASDEYNEYVNTSFNDVFGFFINGENCATVNGDPISINNVNNGKPYGSGGPNSDLYINNDTKARNTEMDGLTKILYCAAKVRNGQTNHAKLAIADAGDSILDSNVFVEAGSLRSVDHYLYSYVADSTKSGDSGTTVTYTLVVTNIGGKADTFQAAIGANNRWTTKFVLSGGKTLTIGPLEPLESAYIDVEVKIPSTAARNSLDSASVTFVSEGDPGVSSSQILGTKALGVNCTFTRELPPFYLPGLPMTATITAEPTCAGTTSFDIEETLPPNWVPSEISGAGSYNAETKKIIWSKLPAKKQVVTYTISPPKSGDVTFTATSKGVVGTKSFTTVGDTTIKEGTGTMPADTDGSNTVILSEYVAYSAAWKNGKNWSGWNPISTTFAAKASELWKKGTKYTYDSTAGATPLCWKTDTASGSGSVTRTVTDTYSPGEPVTVTITVSPDSTGTAWGLEDTPPPRWGVSKINGEKGTFDINTRKVKWGIFADASATPRTFSYVATPPAVGIAAVRFDGVASVDGRTLEIPTAVLTTPVIQYDLSVTTTGKGTVTSLPEGIICGTECRAAFNPGTEVTMLATGARDNTFTGWTGACTGTGPCTVTMDAAKNVSANFAPFGVANIVNSRKKAYPPAGTRGSVSFTVTGNIVPGDWTPYVAANDPWIKNVSARVRNGKGTVTYTIDPNQASYNRTGTISLANTTFSITQDGVPCRILGFTGSGVFSVAGGFAALEILAPYGCAWTAEPAVNVPWLTITDGETGLGPGTVNVSVDASAGTARAAKLKFVTTSGATKYYTIRQNP